MGAAITPAAKLEARDLAAGRGDRVVIDVPALRIQRGECLAIVGPNGAGKTTLLLHLALLQKPARGEVLFDGEPSRGREMELRRRMAVVFQDPLLLDRTVLANVEMGLRLRGQPDRRARALRWLERFGVAQLAGRSARAISGGEAQRVALARAFVLEPEVLFLDEPFSALDTPTREAITGDLAAVLGETRTTTVLVTHDHDEAARIGDRVAVLIDGRIRQEGPPADVFGAPADEDVAAFVGVETIVNAEVTGRAAGLVQLDAHGHAIEAVGAGTFQRALACLRPEDVSLAPAADRPADSVRNHLPGMITSVTRTSADARVEVDCGFRIIARVTRRSVDELRLEPGAPVIASFKATAVHLIPK